MILDGRDGAFGMTYKRVYNSPVSVSSELLTSVKESLFITDDAFDSKLISVIESVVTDFERMTSTSVFLQTIIIGYEYFKGKNKLPFPPVNSVISVNGEESGDVSFTVTSVASKYLEGGDGSSASISIGAGYEVLPINIKNTLVKMADCQFKNMEYSKALIHEIKNYNQWMD
jgi:hypothetical protein